MLTYFKQVLFGMTGWQWLREGNCTQCLRSWQQGKPFIEGPDGVLLCRHCVDALYQQRHLPRERTELNPFDGPNPYASPKARVGTGVCHFCQMVAPIVAAPSRWTRFPICDECVQVCKDLLDAEVAREAQGDSTLNGR